MQTAHPSTGCEGDRGRHCGGYRPEVGIHNFVGCRWFDVVGDEMAVGVAVEDCGWVFLIVPIKAGVDSCPVCTLSFSTHTSYQQG